MNNGRGSTLSPRQNNVNEIRCRWHGTHFFEVVDRHDDDDDDDVDNDDKKKKKKKRSVVTAINK
jgi:hypothetical protein